jgi:hypothetical protein
MSIFNNQVISRIEGLTSGVLQKLADSKLSTLLQSSTRKMHTKLTENTGALKWLTSQLAKQKKTDFKPRNDDINSMGLNTDACQSCCTAISHIHNAAKENLSGANQEVFLMEIGVHFNG